LRAVRRRTAPPAATEALLPRNRQTLHDLHRIPRKYREMRVFLEHPGRRLVRGRLDDHVAGHAVLDVRNTFGGGPFRLAERPTLRNDVGGMNPHPFTPGLHA